MMMELDFESKSIYIYSGSTMTEPSVSSLDSASKLLKLRVQEPY